MRVYVDTSVIGGCLDEEFREWSLRLMKEFAAGKKTAIISDITMRELATAPDDVRAMLKALPTTATEFVSINEESRRLARAYVTKEAAAAKDLRDAQHIAVATVARADLLVSWNFKHIVNVRRIRLFNAVNLKQGYGMLDIRTPREALDEKDL